MLFIRKKRVVVRVVEAVERPTSVIGTFAPVTDWMAEANAKARSQHIDAELGLGKKRRLGKAATGIEHATLLRQTPPKSKVEMLLLLGLAKAGKSTFCKQLRLEIRSASIGQGNDASIVLFTLILAIRELLNSPQAPNLALEPVLALESDLRRAIAFCAHTEHNASLRAFAAKKEAKEPVDCSLALDAMSTLNYPDVDADFDQEDAENIISEACNTLEAYKNDIHVLWDTLKLEQSLQDSLDGSSIYVLDNAARICSTNWIPTAEDILNLRISTVGIEEFLLQIRSDLFYRVVDPAGARGERRKWASFFDLASTIIFVVAADEYDVFEGESKKPRLTEALEVLHQISTSPILKNVPVIVFFNKTDVLRRKIKSGKNPFNQYSDFTGQPDSLDSVRGYIKLRFKEAVEGKKGSSRLSYMHWLQATDAQSCRLTINALNDIIIRQNLELDLL